MNHSYRLVWNSIKGLWVVVSERHKSRVKRTTSSGGITATILSSLLACSAVPVLADDTWNASSGDWATDSNWADGSAPTSSDETYIDNGGTVTVGSSGGTSGLLTMGSSTASTLNISGGTLDTESGVSINSGSSVTVDGSDSQWNIAYDLAVTSGSLSITNGGYVNNDGADIGSNGSVTVDGSGSSWLTMSDLDIYGDLTISDGGTVSVDRYNNISNIYSGATVNVDDATFTIGEELSVSGTLNMTNGASITDALALINGGSVTVDGGSKWKNNGGLYVGIDEDSELDISDGGTVTNTLGYIGCYNSDSDSTVTVTGSGSSWTNNDKLYIGYKGDGTLTISDGASVSSQYGYIGYQSSGSVTVSGSGSSWTNSSALYVGNAGYGSLTIRDSGTVTTNSGSGTVYIAKNSGSTGTLNIGSASGDTAVAAGVLNAATVSFGSGTGSLVFNHTDTDYEFSSNITGAGSVEVDSGTTILTGTNTYTGSTTIHFGTLQIGNGSTSGSITGDITNNSALAFNRSDDVTYSDTISGTGSLTQDGDGTLVLTGENTYSGDTTINSGTLQIGDGDTTGSITGDIINNSALVFNRSNAYSYTGNISGAGSIDLLSGTTHFSGSLNSYTGTMTTSGGTLSIADGETLTLGGNYAQTADGILQIGTSSNSSYGKLVVTGEATFASNSKMDVDVSSANSLSNGGTLSSVVSAGALNASTFKVSDNSALFDFTATVSGNQVNLTVVDGSDSSDSSNSLSNTDSSNDTNTSSNTDASSNSDDSSNTNTSNDTNASSNTDASSNSDDSSNTNTSNDTNTSSNTDASSNSDAASSADTSSSTTPSSSSDTGGTGVSDSVKNAGFTIGAEAAAVLDGFVYGGTTGTDFDNVVTALGQLSTQQEVSDAVSETLPLLASSSSQVSATTMHTTNRIVQTRQSSLSGFSSGDDFLTDKDVWLKPIAVLTNQDERNGVSGYDAQGYGLIGGVDGDIGQNSKLGFALSYVDTTVDGKDTSSNNLSYITSYQAIVYGSHDLAGLTNTTLNWQADIGANLTDGARYISFMDRTATSDYNSYAGHIGVSIDRSFKTTDNLSLIPSLSADYSYIKTEDYSETGAGALNLDVESSNTDEFILMAQTDLNYTATSAMTLVTNIGVGYDFLNGATSVTSSYSGGGSAFTTEGIEQSPWIVDAGLGIVVSINDRTEITARYDLEGRSDFLSQTASVKCKWSF